MLVITFTLTKPLHRLQGTTRRFAKGEYDVRAEISSRDEIGDLSKTFNYMAKTIESKMEELKDAVRRQEEFTANFAHELKTPMTSIIGYADTLYQKTLSPEEVHQLAGIIMNEGMRLEALSFKLLELVTLRDYGRGIPKEDLQKITEAFYMVDKSRARASGGSGLGLALCRRIAELHHAEMRIESRQGEGTKVSILWK